MNKKYTFAIISDMFVIELIKKHYKITGIESCRLMYSGISDIYIIRTNLNRYIFKIYNANRSSMEFIDKQNMFFNIMKNSNILIKPIQTFSGHYITTENFVDGKRSFLLMPFYDKPRLNFNNKIYGVYGYYVSKFHQECLELFENKGYFLNTIL